MILALRTKIIGKNSDNYETAVCSNLTLCCLQNSHCHWRKTYYRLYHRASKGSTSRTVGQPVLLQGEQLQDHLMLINYFGMFMNYRFVLAHCNCYNRVSLISD